MRILKILIWAVLAQVAAAQAGSSGALDPTPSGVAPATVPASPPAPTAAAAAAGACARGGPDVAPACAGERPGAPGAAAAPASDGARFPAHFDRPANWAARAGDRVAGLAQRVAGRVAQGVFRDEAGAARWYAKAARHGDADAAFRLGMLYGQGRGGLPRDLKQASRLLHAAAEAGHVDAQGTLGLSYLLGQGVHQNLRYAYMWISLASDVRGGASLRTKRMVAHAMPKDALPQAEELARRCAASTYLSCDDDAWR